MKPIFTLLIAVSLAASPLLSKPNFVFILIDDMGWTGTSVAMDSSIKDSKSDFYQTPNIELLASQGMVFSNAYAPAALCTPSRAALLTGKTAAELHMTTPGGGRVQPYQKLASPRHVKTLPSETTTIAESLKTRGYATAHLGKWHLGDTSPSEHGFDVHDGATGNDPPNTDTKNNPKDIFGITERAIAFMTEQAAAQKPFYLQLSHYAVHVPIEARDSTKEQFENEKPGKRHSDVNNAAMTHDLDTSIGLLLAKIETLGISKNTYVIFMSDNGAGANPRNPANAPLNSGKGSLYEGGIRVPLIIRGPGIEAQSTSSESVSGIDLFPTINALAQAEASKDISGSSLVPILKGEATSIKRPQTPFLFHYPHYGRGPRQKPQTALIVGEYKILKDLETGSLQLFELRSDLSESADLSKKLPEKLQEMEKRLEAELERVKAQNPTVNPSYDPEATQQRRRRNRD